MKAFSTMLKVEFKLSFRDMNMLIFAIGMPLIITLVLGFVYGNTSAFAQSIPAMTAIGILASGVMGLPLVIADYRDKKILKRYHCTPMSSSFLFVVQYVKYFIYSVASLIIVLAIALCFGYRMDGNFAAYIGAYILVLFSIYSIGMLVAAVSRDLQKAGLICSILYFPMLIFSGTTIPYGIMPKGMQIAVDFLPMTQGINLLKGIALNLAITNFWYSIIVMGIIGIVCTILSIKLFKWE